MPYCTCITAGCTVGGWFPVGALVLTVHCADQFLLAPCVLLCLSFLPLIQC
jgi:hypothetical protein